MDQYTATELAYNNGYDQGYAQGKKDAVKGLAPCDLRLYNPPSSFDGKPCTMCPASGRMDGDGNEV